MYIIFPRNTLHNIDLVSVPHLLPILFDVDKQVQEFRDTIKNLKLSHPKKVVGCWPEATFSYATISLIYSLLNVEINIFVKWLNCVNTLASIVDTDNKKKTNCQELYCTSVRYASRLL